MRYAVYGQCVGPSPLANLVAETEELYKLYNSLYPVPSPPAATSDDLYANVAADGDISQIFFKYHDSRLFENAVAYYASHALHEDGRIEGGLEHTQYIAIAPLNGLEHPDASKLIAKLDSPMEGAQMLQSLAGTPITILYSDDGEVLSVSAAGVDYGVLRAMQSTNGVLLVVS